MQKTFFDYNWTDTQPIATTSTTCNFTYIGIACTLLDKNPSFFHSSKLGKGHGKLSVARIEEHIKLTQPEKNIILYHMGLFGIYTYHEYSAWAIHKAIVGTPQIQAFASIDMADSKRKVEAAHSRRA